MAASKKKRQDAVTNEIVHYMRRMISTGEWPVGSKIPSENQLRATLNVSRTSLRSAIMQLAALNVLKAKQGIGTFVISTLHDEAIFDEAGKSMAVKKEIVQLLEFLKIVAPTAIYVEMLKFNKCFKGLERPLKSALEQQRLLSFRDQGKFLQACFNFHTMIFNALVNEFVKNSIIEAIARLQTALEALQPTISSQVILTLHRKLIYAIEHENPKLARRVLKKLYTYLTSHDYLRHISYRYGLEGQEAEAPENQDKSNAQLPQPPAQSQAQGSYGSLEGTAALSEVESKDNLTHSRTEASAPIVMHS